MTTVTSSKILKGAVKKVVWNWPLTTGVVDYANNILSQQLQDTKWSKRFSQVSRVDDRTSAEFEILLFRNRDSLSRFLKQEKSNITASVVLVNIDAIFLSKKNWKELDKTAINIFRKIRTGGALFFSSPTSLSRWYDNLLFELSHNWPVAGAVDMISRGNVRTYMTKAVAEQTRLATVLPQLINDLETADHVDKRYVKDLDLGSGERRYTFREVSKYLKENISTLKYDQEKDTATTVNKIRTALKTKPVKKAKKVALKKAAKKKKANKKAKKAPGSLGGYRYRGVVPKKKAAKKKVAKNKKSLLKIRKPAVSYGRFRAGGSLSRRRAVKKKAAKKRPRYYLHKSEIKKKVAKKKAAPKKIARKTKRATTKAPRFLMAAFKKPRSNKIINDYLLPKTSYELCIKIGTEDFSFIRAEEEFDTEKIFESPEIKEAVIDLQVRFDKKVRLFNTQITLPRYGDSDSALVPFITPDKKILDIEVFAFYKNRLLQKARLKIEVREKKDKPGLLKPLFKIEAILRNDLRALKKADEVDTSIITSANSPVRVAGMSKGKPLPFRYTPDLQSIIDKIRKIIENNAMTVEEGSSLNDEANVKTLRQLANQGYQLYDNYLGRPDLQGTLQLINNVRTYLPIEFAYTRKAPDGNSTLCKNAKEGLIAGNCMNCIKSEEDERNFICPMSFWLLSRPVERHQYDQDEIKETSDYVLRTDPGMQREPLSVLCNAVHGASGKVDAEKENLSGELAESIRTNCKSLNIAKNWSQWRSFVPGKPDSLILIVHIEENEATLSESLQIGNDMLDKNQFDKSYIKPDPKQEGPVIILIGCQVTNTKAYLFDTVTQLMQNGAAVVISNFSDILGEQAVAIVMRLVEELKKQAGKEATFGEVMLKVRQNLVANGLMVGLSLLSHGDTKWIIKS